MKHFYILLTLLWALGATPAFAVETPAEPPLHPIADARDVIVDASHQLATGGAQDAFQLLSELDASLDQAKQLVNEGNTGEKRDAIIAAVEKGRTVLGRLIEVGPGVWESTQNNRKRISDLDGNIRAVRNTFQAAKEEKLRNIATLNQTLKATPDDPHKKMKLEISIETKERQMIILDESLSTIDEFSNIYRGIVEKNGEWAQEVDLLFHVFKETYSLYSTTLEYLKLRRNTEVAVSMLEKSYDIQGLVNGMRAKQAELVNLVGKVSAMELRI